MTAAPATSPPATARRDTPPASRARRGRAVAGVVVALVAALIVLGATPSSSTPPPCAANDRVVTERQATSCELQLVGSVDLGDGGTGQVAVHGDLAAVVRRDVGVVTLVDLTDPTAPTVRGSYDGGTGQAALDHPLDGDVAFSDDGAVLLHARQTSDYSNEGLHVLDVTDPDQPVLTDLAPQGGMLRVAYGRLDAGEVVVTLDAVAGMTIFRLLRTPAGAKVVPVHADPLPALKVGGPASAGAVIVPDDPVLGVDALYVTDGRTGLRVLDITDPAAPTPLAAWSERGLAAIALQHDADRVLVHAAAEHWFAPSGFPLLHTIEVRPGSATETVRRVLGPFDRARPWKPGGMEMVDGELWVAHGHGGLLAADPLTGAVLRATTDLGEPGPPRPDLGGGAWLALDVTAAGDHVLASDGITGHLQVFAPSEG